MQTRTAKFAIGQVVKHRIYPFRGVIYDVDPTFANTEEWWRSIPGEVRPSKDLPWHGRGAICAGRSRNVTRSTA